MTAIVVIVATILFFCSFHREVRAVKSAWKEAYYEMGGLDVFMNSNFQ